MTGDIVRLEPNPNSSILMYGGIDTFNEAPTKSFDYRRDQPYIVHAYKIYNDSTILQLLLYVLYTCTQYFLFPMVHLTILGM